MNKVTILGCGTSTGVPILGCNCKVCQSTDLRNKRLRTSILIESTHKYKILIDTTPDLRAQLIREKIQMLDAVIITHDHADHVHGMDDLRTYAFKSPLNVYTNRETAQKLSSKFPYIFQREKVFANKTILGGGIPLLNLAEVTLGKNLIGQEYLEFLELPHGHTNTLGIIHSKCAYLTDLNEISDDQLNYLENSCLELLIIDCLRYKPHTTHLHLDKTLKYVEKISPKLTVLTHLGHELDYVDLSYQLRKRGTKNVFPAYDGQCFYYS
jgi:phosphoribosyl 1,2-cyclic phosphate phosphodiesterase